MDFKNCTYLIGVDEVGRGCVAGPVAVGAMVFYTEKAERYLYGIRDTKKLTPHKREEWYQKICTLRNKGLLDFSVSFSAHRVIDKKGIVPAIKEALEKSLIKLSVKPQKALVLLDGGLKAPKSYNNQQTIIKGDEKKRIIAAASIVAKVMRDRKMVLFSKKYPLYGFERHKGYGTKLHRDALKKYETCAIHRRSFCKKFLSASHSSAGAPLRRSGATRRRVNARMNARRIPCLRL